VLFRSAQLKADHPSCIIMHHDMVTAIVGGVIILQVLFFNNSYIRHGITSLFV